MTVLIDYGMGNIGSVVKALSYLGEPVTVTQDPGTVLAANRVILPGVGAMAYAVGQLRERGLDDAIRRYKDLERPFLGICLGMQLMFEKSEEGQVSGLGLLAGTVRRFRHAPGLKVPHMGWNALTGSRLALLPERTSFYFVHSYYAAPSDPSVTAAFCDHGIRFVAAVQAGSILLTQFHPEKSGDAGLDLLRSWLSQAD